MVKVYVPSPLSLRVNLLPFASFATISSTSQPLSGGSGDGYVTAPFRILGRYAQRAVFGLVGHCDSISGGAAAATAGGRTVAFLNQCRNRFCNCLCHCVNFFLLCFALCSVNRTDCLFYRTIIGVTASIDCLSSRDCFINLCVVRRRRCQNGYFFPLG